MPFLDKVKNIFRASGIDDSKKKLPPIVQFNVNPLDSWDIINELGDGAFGKVHKVVSKSDKKLFAAAKAIEVQEGEVLEDFLIEIEILTSCHHPNIVELYAAYFIENKLHMMLEFCAGGAVDSIMIELEKPLTESQIACIAKYVNDALIFLHDNLVIHRDLKAGNILITHDAVIKLADFGVSAKLKNEQEKRDTFIGTPYWMAPEVMMCETFKDQPYSTISDIWSFGITLIELAQMEPPHSNLSPMRVLIKVQKSEAPGLDRPEHFSKNFSDFLTKCLKKPPHERSSAHELSNHPFLLNGSDLKPIRNLLAEVNAEVQEEIIEVEEHASMEGSLHESEDRSELVFTPVEEVPSVPDPTPSKRAAPPPPSRPVEDSEVHDLLEKNTDISVREPDQKDLPNDEPSNREQLSITMNNDDSITPELIVSPQTQAFHILDDLNDALGQESPDDSKISNFSLFDKTQSNTEFRDSSVAKRAEHATPVSNNINYFDEGDTLEVPTAPPEPPVDYEPPRTEKKESIDNKDALKCEIQPDHMKQPGEPRLGNRGNQHRKTVTKKTRVYMIDGMQVTSTTVHILGAKQDLQLKKQQLQDLRRIQREEARQKQEIQAEAALLAEQQDKKFQHEKTALIRQYEFDMESIERKQKKEIEEAEKAQEEEMRLAQKKIKSEREKDIRIFRDRLKQEKKFAKQEVDLLPRAQRKEIIKAKQDNLEHECRMKEAEFVLHMQKNTEASLGRLAQKHKETIAQMERGFLVSRHLLLRAKENSEWELEEKQMGEKYIMHRRLLKDEYYLLRSQMMVRHQQELSHVQKIQHEEELEMVRALQADRKKLPKVLRHEAKTRSNMFKESLKIGSQLLSPDDIVEKMRHFEEMETTRVKKALEEYDQKCAKKLAALKKQQSSTYAELEMMQNEKRKQLLEKEQITMCEHERKYVEMKEQWQSELITRKTILERQFEEELESQEMFYGVQLPPLGSTPVVPPMMHTRYN